MTVVKRDISVFARCERTEAAVQAQNLRSVDGNGLQRLDFRQALTRTDGGFHSDVMLRDHRMVRHQREFDARLVEDARRAEAEVAQLDLGAVGEQRAENALRARALEILSDQVTFGTVLNGVV